MYSVECQLVKCNLNIGSVGSVDGSGGSSGNGGNDSINVAAELLLLNVTNQPINYQSSN